MLVDEKKSVKMEVLVFKTSVESQRGVEQLKPLLDCLAGEDSWNFALDDCDKILRIEGTREMSDATINLLTECGFDCRELGD